MRPTTLVAWAVVAIGVLLRVALWSLNPPNNAYDDHLEVVAHYATHGERPEIASCWQCYQPPAYYAVAGATLRGTYRLSDEYWLSWRAVQGLSALASCLSLLLVWTLLHRLSPGRGSGWLLALAVAATFPRDIFAAAFVGNDAMLVATCSAAVLAFVAVERTIDRSPRWLALAGLAMATVAAAWTKQSGLICLILPAAAILYWARSRWPRRQKALAIGVLALGCVLSLGDEMYRTAESGFPLASNQHFFDWAEDQEPGTLSAVSFSDFRLTGILAEPFKSDRTVDSFWTELFARLWFDYEQKLVPDMPLSRWVARAGFLGGLVIVALWLLGLLDRLRSPEISLWLPLALMSAAFVLVPVVQTVRFPYFSSMKAMFVLPALAPAILFVAFGAQCALARRRLRWIPWLAVCLLLVSVLGQLLATYWGLDRVLAKGPVWPFPPLPW